MTNQAFLGLFGTLYLLYARPKSWIYALSQCPNFCQVSDPGVSILVKLTPTCLLCTYILHGLAWGCPLQRTTPSNARHNWRYFRRVYLMLPEVDSRRSKCLSSLTYPKEASAALRATKLGQKSAHLHGWPITAANVEKSMSLCRMSGIEGS